MSRSSTMTTSANATPGKSPAGLISPLPVASHSTDALAAGASLKRISARGGSSCCAYCCNVDSETSETLASRYRLPNSLTSSAKRPAKESRLRLPRLRRRSLIDADDDRVVNDAIEHRGGEHAVAGKRAIPAAEGEIRS